MHKTVFGYITLPDIKTARRLSKLLLDSRLVACTNILPVMESHYTWESKREKTRETVMIVKSLSHKTKKIEALVSRYHPYSCPCIAFFRVQANVPYSNWIRQSVD